jgi:PAS domain S-box-containing protein
LVEAIGRRLTTLLSTLAISRELQESKVWLEESQRVAQFGHWIWDLDANQVIYSAENFRIFGVPPQDGPVNLATIRERIHPEDRERVFRTAEDAIRSETRANCEHRIIRPDGEIRIVQSIGDLKKDASGRPFQMFGTTQDVTERKRAEEERLALSRNLLESKARLEEAQRIARVGHYHWDLIANRVMWSDELYRIYGLRPQGRPIDMAMVGEMMHPEDRERVFRAAEEAVRSGGLHTEAEHRIVRLDGEVRIVLGLGTVKRDAAGQAYEMFGTVQDITERKRAEQALHRSQFYLSEAARLAHMGGWASSDLGLRWSEDLGIYWSDEIYNIFGLDPKSGAPSFQQYLDLIHPEDRAAMAETVRAMHEQRLGCDVTKRIVRPDGKLRYVRCVAVPDMEGGVFKGFHGTAIDVTEHELLTQELRRQQGYLNEAQTLTHCGSWACNLVTREIFHSSDENARLYGFDPSQGPIPFEHYYNTILAEDEPRLRARLEDAIRSGTDYDVEFRIRRTDGAIRFLRGIGHHNPSGENGDYVGITMDITEHEMLTQELRRQQTYLNEAQALAHIGSWATNLATAQIHHISDETFRLHGFDPSKGPVSLERFFKTVHPEDEPGVRNIIENAVRTRTDYDISGFRICRPDGGTRFFRTIGHHDFARGIGEYMGITMDITEQKRAEDERERLRQLEADLARINRVNMMGELAAAIAHEVKQPIAASVTSANALLRWLAHDPPDLERARATADRIAQDGNRAAEIINSLRSFYKTGSRPERTIININDVIREMTVLLANDAARHSVAIRVELAPGIPNIRADRVQIQQVLMNLMLNAIEAMHDAGGDLTISSEVNPKDHLIISVRDAGIGLPKAGADQIFDPFYTTKPQGTGMGLTITRSIVQSYGGRVWAVANRDAGATIHFTLSTEGETPE